MDDPAQIAELALELGEDRGRKLLLALSARAALREFNRQAAVRYAVQLLRQGAKRSQIRDRLMQRYELERSAAYLRIDEAVQVRCRYPLQLSTDAQQKWTQE